MKEYARLSCSVTIVDIPAVIYLYQFLLSHALQISYAQAKDFATKKNAIFFETSAYKATNVKEIFVELGESTVVYSSIPIPLQVVLHYMHMLLLANRSPN